MTLIHGPAGFGKTTLAAQWREVLADEGITVAWLTIDSDDNNVVWFLAHLIDAVRSVRPTSGEGLRQALEVRGEEAEHYVLTSLIDEIESDSGQFAAVISDWHRVNTGAVIDALTYLLTHAGHHLQVVAISRTRAGLPTGRLRVRDELTEIDSVALRFDTSESRALLVDVGGLELDEAEVAHLEQATDGWVAALQLASLSLRECDDPAAFISRMSGRHHAIGEYLAENVLHMLNDEMLDFLMATSLTERICGDLACALAGVNNGQALLEAAEERDLFLRRLDDEREWFRYHHLFAQYLQRRLSRDQPLRISQLHKTASAWFAEHDMLREAVDHALAAGDEESATALAELLGVQLIERSQMSTVLAMVSKLPAHIVARSPRLQLTIVWANVSLQRPAAAGAGMAAFESAMQERARGSSDLRAMKVEANVIRAVVDCHGDRTTGVQELVAECLSAPNSVMPLVVAAAADVESYLDVYRFEFDAVRRRQDRALPFHQRSIGPFTLVYGRCLVGTAAMEELDVVEAERCYREALRVANQFGDTHSHPTRLACGLLGELLYERGEIDVAQRRDRQDALPDGGLGEITAQLRDETQIRGLHADQPLLACERAQAWVERLESARRPRALLQAKRLLVAALSAAGRIDEAKETLALVAAQCAERGMRRYLLDGGPHVVTLVEELRDDLRAGRRNPSSTGVLAAFLDSVTAAH